MFSKKIVKGLLFRLISTYIDSTVLLSDNIILTKTCFNTTKEFFKNGFELFLQLIIELLVMLFV